MLWRGVVRAAPVRTIDISEGGACVRTPSGRLPSPGDRVEIVVASPAEVLVPRASLRAAVVVRVNESQNEVAVRFLAAHAKAGAASRTIAA